MSRKIKVRLAKPHITGSDTVMMGKVTIGHMYSIPDNLYRAILFLDKRYPTFEGSREECVEWLVSQTQPYVLNFLDLGDQEHVDSNEEPAGGPYEDP